MTIEKLIRERSEECEVFSNPLRFFIAIFVAAKREASWSDLRNALEKHVGIVNPNTLSFHLGELLDAGFINKIDVEGQPKYRIVGSKLQEVIQFAREELFKKIEEEI